MWKVRHYVPLLGFLLPTVVIGYGIIIPRSCIAGVNQLTVGFATALAGASLAYVAGIRSVARSVHPAPPPWRRRVARYINRQASAPRGLFGRLLGLIWRIEHREVNRRTLDVLGIEPRHRVLEIGCGPGAALQEAANRATHGHVVGIDVSEAMVSIARRRNRVGISRGRVSVRHTDGTDLRIEPAAFDRAFSVHCIYFWRQPERILSQLADALCPGGRLVLAFRANTPDVPERFRDDIYRFYAPGEIEAMLARAGFTDIRASRHPELNEHLVWMEAHRPAVSSPTMGHAGANAAISVACCTPRAPSSTPRSQDAHQETRSGRSAPKFVLSARTCVTVRQSSPQP